MKNIFCWFVLFVGLVSGCANTPSGNSASIEVGKASYYAAKYQGRLTASGEPYDESAMTAAHKTLPFGSRIRVINMMNQKSVVVRVNDRGPFVKGRIVDLSKKAFSKIGDTQLGVIDVKIEVLSR